MEKDKISLDALNEHLFAVISDLRNGKGKSKDDIDSSVEVAKAVALLGKTVVDTYKIKVDAMKVLGDSTFPVQLAQAMKKDNLLDLEFD